MTQQDIGFIPNVVMKEQFASFGLFRHFEKLIKKFEAETFPLPLVNYCNFFKTAINTF